MMISDHDTGNSFATKRTLTALQSLQFMILAFCLIILVNIINAKDDTTLTKSACKFIMHSIDNSF